MHLVQRLSFLILIPLTLSLGAQNEFSKWYFGINAGLNFSTTPPTILTNAAMFANEGCASISDGSGNLLFYTNGTGVYNSAHTLMANGNGLSADPSSTQSSLIVKQPGNTNIYYIFTTKGGLGLGSAAYSVVDMNLAAGLGSVTVKNATLYAPTCEKQVAVQDCNGKDVWIISHKYNSDNFMAYSLTSVGLNLSPVISNIGEVISDPQAMAGHLKISPNGRKLAMATASTTIPNNPATGGFQLFDFDPATGIVSNSLTLLNKSMAYGFEFSPDGTKLFGTTWQANSVLYQWDICAPTNSAIIASQYSLSLVYGGWGAGSIQRAIDGKLYITWLNQNSLHVINNPNVMGSAMNFSMGAQSIAPKITAGGLPNYINSFVPPLPALFNSTLACQTSSFYAPPATTYSSGCTSISYSPSSYLWDFGEPAVGASNTSTLSNPIHTYSTTGTYTVTLIMYSNCTNDTLKKVITLTTPGPNPTVAGPDVICKGEKYTYTVSGGTTYKWFNNSTAPTLTLAPTTTTVYSVSATTNGCTLSKTFTVTVNPCTGIEAVQSNGVWRVFPNPFSNELSIESSVASKLMLFDLNGSLVLESDLNSGQNKINTEQLKAGVYTLKALSADGAWRARFVKME
jgi:PKD repeat protein